MWTIGACTRTRGKFCLFDPALLRGDAELDLACFTCFASEATASAFLTAYQTRRSLSSDWRRQREQLYHFYVLVSSFLLTRNDSLLKRACRIADVLLPQLPARWPSVWCRRRNSSRPMHSRRMIGR